MGLPEQKPKTLLVKFNITASAFLCRSTNLIRAHVDEPSKPGSPDTLEQSYDGPRPSAATL